MLRRTAVILTTLGLALTFTAAPVAAHEGHEGHEKRNPGQNKEVISLRCDGVGELTVQVTSAGEGRGVGRIIEGGKGVLIPRVFTFEIRNETTDQILESEVEELGPGQRSKRTTTCAADEFFRGTVAEIAEFDPDYAEELRAIGVRETDVIVARLTVEASLRGPIARGGRK